MSLRLIDARETKICASRAKVLMTDRFNMIFGSQAFPARKLNALWTNLVRPW
jgi:hypothetical protein